METATAERLHRDVFPAEVYDQTTGKTYGRARAFITDRRVLAWAEDAEGRPVLVVDQPLDGEPPERNRGSLFGQLAVFTPSGGVFVSRARGCGCASALKALAPPVPW